MQPALRHTAATPGTILNSKNQIRAVTHFSGDLFTGKLQELVQLPIIGQNIAFAEEKQRRSSDLLLNNSLYI